MLPVSVGQNELTFETCDLVKKTLLDAKAPDTPCI